MPLVPFKLLPQCWSSASVSLSKSVCGFFKRNCLGLQQFLPLTQSPLVFAARSCGDLSSWHWNPGLAGLVCGWDSSLARYPSQIFIHHTCVLDQPILHLHPFYQSGWMWFLEFFSCQTSIELYFWWFWAMIVPYFSCNFAVVLQRGKPCLPTPPSWPEVREHMFSFLWGKFLGIEWLGHISGV